MFETSIAGSLPKPAWLAETHKLWPQWMAEGDALRQAKADATLLWIKAQEDAGLDIVCDGEQSRQHFVHGFGRGLAALELLPALLANLEWRPDKLHAAIDSGMYATDVAVEAAVAGVPFRDAYKAAAQASDTAGQGRTPEGSLAARVSPGAAADLQLDVLRARWQALL